MSQTFPFSSLNKRFLFQNTKFKVMTTFFETGVSKNVVITLSFEMAISKNVV